MLPDDASDADCARHHRLAQIHKLIRLDRDEEAQANRKAIKLVKE
jgi:hypothetical protein